MAKEIAISKKIKISEAQQYMLLAVVGASVILGVAISLTVSFVNQISYNVNVIMAQDQSIDSYSNFIRDTGICTEPNGKVYTQEELKECNPDSIDVSYVPDTLRSSILTTLASSKSLNSVAKSVDSNCINSKTGKTYTYKELNQEYENATTSAELTAASQRIRSCSALRIIPDALPSFKNEEALLASLNQIFNLSGWVPESLSPSDDKSTSSVDANLNAMAVNLSIESNTATAMTVLKNIERSIRDFDITNASIEWSGNDTLVVRAGATAYYVDPVTLLESDVTVKATKGTTTKGATK